MFNFFKAPLLATFSTLFLICVIQGVYLKNIFELGVGIIGLIVMFLVADYNRGAS